MIVSNRVHGESPQVQDIYKPPSQIVWVTVFGHHHQRKD